MESAALIMLFSSVNVLFGWQPMPDSASNGGGPKLEYIVQIEPELVATLQAGQSIPITSDIPDDIGPIGRIRIVVGRDELPRQKLVTNFKPWPGRQPREGLVETQFTVPPVQSGGSGRYRNQPATGNSILPPSSGSSSNAGGAGTNPFGRALQQGAEQARNLAADVKQQIMPPTGNQLFGGSNVGQGVQNAIDNTTNQLRRGLQQGVEQVADRTGEQLRQAVDNVGQGARNAADQFGRSLNPERSVLNNGQGLNSATILPPSSQPVNQARKGQRIDQPVQQQRQQPRQQQPQQSAPPARFAESSPAGTNPSSRPGLFNAPWPSTNGIAQAATPVGNAPSSRYDNRPNQQPAPNSQWPREPSGRDAFDLANRPSQNTAPRYAAGDQPGYNTANNNTANNTANNGAAGPRFPKNESPPLSQQSVSTNWPSQPSKPEIRNHMQNQPAADAMQTVGNTQGYQPQTVGRQSFDNGPTNTQPRDLGWNQNNSNPSYTNLDSNSKTMFPMILSWVLLTSSGVGNAYLWLSYIDVRNKYRGVVHSSPTRRDRYDD